MTFVGNNKRHFQTDKTYSNILLLLIDGIFNQNAMPTTTSSTTQKDSSHGCEFDQNATLNQGQKNLY